MQIGYARVSTDGQNLERQLGALNAERVEKIYAERASGKSLKGRPKLETAISSLGVGDVLVIAEWDRATRSMIDGIAILQRIADRGAAIKVLDKPWLDLTTTMGKGILAFLSALSEDERERITERAKAGRRIAKSNGVRFGRKPKLTPHQQNLARQRLKQGENSRTIGKDFGVAHTTILRLNNN
jgi:DNA invertase Pin-like site-specific DNA recombinase